MSQVKREDSLETVNTLSSANTNATSNNDKQPQPIDWIKEILKEQGVNEYDDGIFKFYELMYGEPPSIQGYPPPD